MNRQMRKTFYVARQAQGGADVDCLAEGLEYVGTVAAKLIKVQMNYVLIRMGGFDGMWRVKVRWFKQGLMSLIIPGVIILSWWIASRTDRLLAGNIPPMNEVLFAFRGLVTSGLYWQYVSVSLVRVLGGFFLAALLAIPTGIMVGSHSGFSRLVNPTLEFLRQIPPVAWVPLFIVWLGLGEAPKLAVIAYAAFFPIFLNTEAAVASIGVEYEEVARSLGLSRRRRFRLLLLPAASTGIATGLRLGLGVSWRALVAAEMLASFSGLGYMIMAARSLVRTDEMFIGIFSVGVLGMLMDWVGRGLQARLQPWTAAGGQRKWKTTA